MIWLGTPATSSLAPRLVRGLARAQRWGFWTQEHLTTATKMYREMGMTYWIEKAEAEMSELA